MSIQHVSRQLRKHAQHDSERRLLALVLTAAVGFYFLVVLIILAAHN